MLRIRIIILMIAVSFLPAIAQDQVPPANYIDEGLCPFEGCVYGQWTVTRKTEFHANIDSSSKVVFTVDKGEDVIGITGDVVTLKPGRALVLNPLILGEGKIRLKMDDILYIMSYTDLGFKKFWFDGKTFSDDTDMVPLDERNIEENYAETLSLKVLEDPVNEWWVKVVDRKGQAGWALVDGNFDKMDSLAK